MCQQQKINNAGHVPAKDANEKYQPLSVCQREWGGRTARTRRWGQTARRKVPKPLTHLERRPDCTPLR
eukprot:3215018-Pyramimonas_sp.AAC.1